MNTALQVFEHKKQRVLTTKQLSDFYGTEVQVITNNFNRNKERFKRNVHFFRLEGEDLRAFRTTTQIDLSSNRLNVLYLWTERGAARHAKMLNSDKAWEVFERLEETYFAMPEVQQLAPPPTEKPVPSELEAALRAIVRDEVQQSTTNIVERLHHVEQRPQVDPMNLRAAWEAYENLSEHQLILKATEKKYAERRAKKAHKATTKTENGNAA
jgi:hypothetical protein